MRLVPTRRRLRTLGLVLVAASLGVIGAGSTGLPGAADGRTYELAALLMSEKGGPAYACWIILQSNPPQCGGGIRVDGADIEHMPGVTRYENGTLQTPIIHLVGHFARRTLTLTEPPRPVAKASVLTAPCQQEFGFQGAPEMFVRQTQVFDAAQSRGITVLETMPCDHTTLGVTVAVADDETVSWLTSHYGPVKVAGWLQPVPSGR